MSRRITVHLRGPLRRFWSEPIEVVVDNVAQAIEVISRQIFPTPQRIRVAGFPTEASLYQDLEVDEIHIFPQVNGGKNGGFFQIIIGVALIAAAILMPGSLAASVSAVMAGHATAMAMITATMFMVGVSSTIGGLSQLLFPQPSINPGAGDQSKYLGAPQSTTAIGTPIPIIYGLRRVGFQFLSFNTSASNYVPSNASDQ